MRRRAEIREPIARGSARGLVEASFGTRGTTTCLDAEGFRPIGEVVEGMDAVDAFYAAYGDGPPRGEGPYQAMAAAPGNEYFDADFPELTKILSVTVAPGS